MLVVKKVSKVYGVRTVLSGISFALGPGQKAALVGPNGVGKSTLLKILSGIEAPHRGEVRIARHLGVGYLAQEIDALKNETVGEYIRRVSGIADMESSIEDLAARLDTEEALQEYAEMTDLHMRAGGYDFDRKMRQMLDGFSLSSVNFDDTVARLSGGQKTKVSLSAILLRGVDMLFLDEPTNNLDLPALIWLEEYLIASPAICVIASHDRRFLDRVVSKVLEIDWFRRDATLHTGNYTEYARRKALEMRRLQQEWRLQQEDMKRLRAASLEKHDWAAKGAVQPWNDNDKMGRNFARDRSKKLSVTGNAIAKRLEKLEKIERPEEREPLRIRFDIESAASSPHIALHSVVAGYESGFRTKEISLDIPFGSRVCIVGSNGSGKSTLLKTIAGDLKPLAGSVEKGEGAIVGNFTQEHENLPKHRAIGWFFGEVAGIFDTTRITTILHQFHILIPDVSRDTIGDLSPGERARLLLAVYAQMNVNTLVLDEPTNHLDVEAIEALEEVLETYEGTVILVTHDRYFLEHIPAIETYAMEEGMLRKIGNYAEYSAKLSEKARFMIRRLSDVMKK